MTHEELPPDLPPEYHYSHGLTGVGVCGYCGDVRTLFVHSLVHTADNCTPCCAGCTRILIEQFHNELPRETESDKQFRRIVSDVYAQWTENAPRYQHTREEILAHPQGCQSCARFGIPARLREAVSLSDNSVIGNVHVACAFECSECSKYYYRPHAEHNDGYRNPLNRVAGRNGVVLQLCNTCFDPEGYQECDQCHLLEHENGFLFYDFIGDSVCRVCQSNIQECRNCQCEVWVDSDHECDESFATIKSWDFRPSGGFTFHGTDPNNLFMGFELEVEGGDAGDFSNMASHVDSVLSKGNRGFLKNDGSLDDGFEIVTQPHTLAEYMEHFPFGILDDLRSDGFRSWDTETCGFHVHISRKAFGWKERGREYNEGKYHAHLLRFTKLIYDNSRQVTRLVAGRSSSRWASYQDRNNLVMKVKHGHQSNSRYSAVNVSNTQTIEVRVFKGSLKVERVKAYLQFVHSVAEYTRDLHVSPNENNLMWRKYSGWLHKNEKAYPELVSLITARLTNDNEEN